MHVLDCITILLLCKSVLGLAPEAHHWNNKRKSSVLLEKISTDIRWVPTSPDEHNATLSRRSHGAIGDAVGRDLTSYESALGVLRSYHSVHGDLVVPRRYVVPADDRFPQAWHGVLLACTVYNMKWWQEHVKQKPERVSQLNELGFVWERLQSEWNLVLEALVTFSLLHGHVLVPCKFVVPRTSDWSKATWGIPLGDCVYRIRARNDFLRSSYAAARRDQLDGLGFVWDVHEHRYRTFYRALRHFAQLNGAGVFSEGRNKPLRVPSTYTVPRTEEWPTGVWGYPLGARCVAIRQKQLYIKDKPYRRAMLDELGFHWSGNADFGWLRVSHAAAIYSRLNKRKLDVPYSFKVPHPPHDMVDKDEWPWPEHLWGLPLGQRLKDVRLKGAYLHGEFAEKRRKQLDALGFRWSAKKPGRPKTKGSED